MCGSGVLWCAERACGCDSIRMRRKRELEEWETDIVWLFVCLMRGR